MKFTGRFALIAAAPAMDCFFAAAQQDAATLLLALDVDHSGIVDKAELRAFAEQYGITQQQVDSDFGSVDTDGDGALSAQEIDRALQGSSAGAGSAPDPRATPAAASSAGVPQGGEASADSVPDQRGAPAATSFAGAPQGGVAMVGNVPDPRASPAAASLAGAPQGGVASADSFLVPRVAPAATSFSGAPQVLASLTPPAAAVPVLADRLPVPRASSLLDTEMLDSVKQNAGDRLAQQFSESAAELIADWEKAQAEALALENKAKSLRGRAAHIVASAFGATQEAASGAAAQVIQHAKQQLHELDAESSEALGTATSKAAKLPLLSKMLAH